MNAHGGDRRGDQEYPGTLENLVRYAEEIGSPRALASVLVVTTRLLGDTALTIAPMNEHGSNQHAGGEYPGTLLAHLVRYAEEIGVNVDSTPVLVVTTTRRRSAVAGRSVVPGYD